MDFNFGLKPQLPAELQPIDRSVRSLQQFVALNVVRSKEPKCHTYKCGKLKGIIDHHSKTCSTKLDGDCPTCKELVDMCCYHVKHCRVATIKATARCPGPFYSSPVWRKRKHMRLAQYGSLKLDRLRWVRFYHQRQQMREEEALLLVALSLESSDSSDGEDKDEFYLEE